MQTITPANDFLWGAATAAYQIEGAADTDGKGPSIWDVFAATPGKIASGDTGRVACDHYRRWRDDVDLMRRLNLQAYRFSLSWPRVQPQGRGPANEAGWSFYSRLVDELRAANIEPVVTLYHWDLPAALQMELGGWQHPDLPRIFADYAATAYARLGDRVRLWLTINEPWVVAVDGHLNGSHAPGVRDRAAAYRVGHNLLRAHAYAVAAYRAARASAGDAISFALNSPFYLPASADRADQDAAERCLLDFAGWFAEPVYTGDYPALLRERLADVLPEFTPEDSRLLRLSQDFHALNYYATAWMRHAPGAGPMEAETIPQPQLPHTEMGWTVYPDGLAGLLHWLDRRYPGLPFYITENGAAFSDPADARGFVNDLDRTAYLRDHIAAAGRARAEGIDLRGYMVWSLLDNLEWAQGFSKRFGLVRCDFATLERTIKASGRWYADWIAGGGYGGAR